MAVVAGIGNGSKIFSSPIVSRTTDQPVVDTSGYLRTSVVLATVEGLSIGGPDAIALAPAPDPTPTPTPEQTPAPTPAPKPPFWDYTIQPGDTVEGIAAGLGMDPQYILWNNPAVSEHPDVLIAGKVLRLPGVNGIIYHVKLGDTLSDIAAYYGISVQSIIDFAPNNLASPDNLADKTLLVLPGAVPPPAPTAPGPILAAAPAPEPAPAPPSQVAPPEVQPTAPPPAAPPPPPAPAPAPASRFIWPFVGNITTYFSGGHPAIDIDGYGRHGAPVVASAGGQVVWAAGDNSGYGLYVIIQHPDGSRTLYAHLSSIGVSVGQEVWQGETLGGVGSTGYSTGTHLHFVLYINGAPVNPLNYLP